MFKKKIICLTLIFTILYSALQIPVQSSTFCIGNCYSCPITPQQCPYIQSIPFPNENHNCLPFSIGSNCETKANGFQTVHKDPLTGWMMNGQASPGIETCTLYHQPATVPKFQALGPITSGATISKNLTINRDSIDVIILEIGLTINSANVFRNQSTTNDTNVNQIVNPNGTITIITTVTQNDTTSTITERTFASVRVTGSQVNFNLELNYPTIPSDMSVIVNSTCGINLQYAYAVTLPQTVTNIDNTNLRIEIESIGSTNTTWGLTKFEVLAGCGGFMIPNSTSKCGACASGYFPIQTSQNLLLGCELCDPTCLACTSTGCTLCQPYTQLNIQTSQCQHSQYYMNVTNYQIISGQRLTSQNNQTNFHTLISPDIANNSIILQTQLESPAPFSLILYLLYSNDFILNLNGRSVNISQGYKTLLTIPPSQFRNEIGMYDNRLLGGTRKFYVKNVYIDQMNVQNLQKNIRVQIDFPSGTNNIYLANYQVVQYQCAARCSQCDRINNVCLQCNSFFVNQGAQPCAICPNGFYLNKQSDSSISNYSLLTKGPDQCLKCYSTCKQCVGSSINQCNQCFGFFQLDTITFNNLCINCIFNQRNNPGQTIPDSCQRCLKTYQPDTIFTTTQCGICVQNATINDILNGEMCRTCWINNGLAYGRCIPGPQSGLTFYGSDITNGIVDQGSWAAVTSSSQLQKIDCSKDYVDLWGVNNTNNQNNVTIRWSTSGLPTHTGLYIIFNVFKTDIIIQTTQSGARRAQNIYVNTGDGNIYAVQLINRKSGQPLTPGTNLCGGNANDMIYTFTYNLPKHTTQTYQIQITSQGGGIYVRQLQVFLGNCDACPNYQLNYEVNWLPRYIYNTSISSGLDVWVQFNKQVQVSNNTDLKHAFNFQIDKLPNMKLDAVQFNNDLALNNRLHYYLPLDESFLNGSLAINVAPNASIFGINSKALQTSRRLLLNSPLNVLSNSQLINRFSSLNSDDLVSTGQIYQFYNFFQWFALITMIVCIFLGIGVIFEEFSIMLQLLFLHVYISSALLPATFKAPLIGLHRMEHLNYFADPHAQQIQWQWFGNYEHPSPYIFQQYNKDILFERSFYPTIIINIMYLIWFIIWFIIYKAVTSFQTSKSTIVGFFRNIPARPLNYADQIWRYQFITTIWAAFMQFHILKNDTAWEKLNLALCFISFIISIIWPFFVVCFTYRMNAVKYSTQFMYKYEDIYFKKMETISEGKIKYYNYVLIRFLRYLVIALFINVFIDHEIVAPVILICANIIQIIYVVSLRIFYNSILGAVFKVTQNLLFIAIEVALLFVYGLSDNANDSDFLNLGYALNVLYVITIVVGLLRFGYYAYQKFKHMKYNMKFGMDNGQIVKIGPTPLPTTDRYEYPTNTNL